VPISISSQSPGVIQVSLFNRTQYVNYVYLNVTPMQNKPVLNWTVNFTRGNVILSGLNAQFKGEYNATARVVFAGNSTTSAANSTRTIRIYYSKINKSLPYTFTDSIFFAPETNSSQNVTPFGQGYFVPLFNVTGMAKSKSFTVIVRLNQSYACMNITASNTTNKTGGIILNTSFQVFGNYSVKNPNFPVRMWADLANCALTPAVLRPQLIIQTCCNTCKRCW
jgi:hypothetical protein